MDGSPLQGSFFTCPQPRAHARGYSLSAPSGREILFLSPYFVIINNLERALIYDPPNPKSKIQNPIHSPGAPSRVWRRPPSGNRYRLSVRAVCRKRHFGLRIWNLPLPILSKPGSTIPQIQNPNSKIQNPIHSPGALSRVWRRPPSGNRYRLSVRAVRRKKHFGLRIWNLPSPILSEPGSTIPQIQNPNSKIQNPIHSPGALSRVWRRPPSGNRCRLSVRAACRKAR